MSTRVDQLPAVLTSFAYREEYFPELEGMLATARKHHPTWHLVTGRGPVSGFKGTALEVESPQGNSRWTLPVPFELDGSLNDWLRIVWMKAWWVAQVWHQFGSLGSMPINRVIWLEKGRIVMDGEDVPAIIDAYVQASGGERRERTPVSS